MFDLIQIPVGSQVLCDTNIIEFRTVVIGYVFSCYHIGFVGRRSVAFKVSLRACVTL